MKRIYLVILICSLVMFAYSQTYKYENIHVNTTWKTSESPVHVNGVIKVDSNVTLTIEPGVIVIYDDNQSKLDVNGKLISEGVVFKKNYSNYNYYNHKDSTYFNGRYYAPADYPKVKDAYDKVNYETWFMPGLSYSYFQPKASDSIGKFSGIAVEYLIYARVNQNDNPGPSHFRIYSKINILNSTKTDISSMFLYTVGLDLSLERNPQRTFLIPYFGLEVGGLAQKNFGKTTQFTPTFGIHVLSKRNIFINIHGGYIYPISNFEMLQGWYGQAGVNFALW